ncbi:hypothetical protein K458DRAFT_454831 [Lentithecium fluviatile CBS 122367]|uniref:Uncharacterized protein n=1 Tax=Lentithecium fluviatile CBS 122367 TaxID=1168545 RepID=A0A6G1JJS6_9PLEO|nr:hypothetical protein K458DRAFT_454831 [Lentithecium fluviatile CBS 122367]
MAAGMDMTYPWLAHAYSADGPLNMRTIGIEYAPHLNPSWDPYPILYELSRCNSPFSFLSVAAWRTRDCVGPVRLSGNSSWP